LLRREFGTTLARFDYLAQLERHPDGLRMSALSRYLMVTGGNVTGLTTQLEADGHVERLPDPEDGRSWRVRLTPAGRRHFTAMARVHEGWLRDLFDGVPAGELQQLYGLLGHLRHTVADHVGGDVSERPVTTAPSAPAPHTAHTARTARTAPMAPAAPARAARTKRTAASTRSRRAPAQPSKPAARRVR
jgi:DNA-binding MarR family transcriptional regulator